MKRLIVLFVLWLAATLGGHAETPVILVFGDSISAGYGLPRVEQGWVALLRAKLKNQGYGYQVVNASVSGETTAGGLARLPRALALHHPVIVILELGGNDGLRALPIEQMRANLSQMVDLAAAAGAKVLLLGMRIPPNYGPNTPSTFSRVFADVARREARAARALPAGRYCARTPTSCRPTAFIRTSPASRDSLENVWPALMPLLKALSVTWSRPATVDAAVLRARAGVVLGLRVGAVLALGGRAGRDRCCRCRLGRRRGFCGGGRRGGHGGTPAEHSAAGAAVVAARPRRAPAFTSSLFARRHGRCRHPGRSRSMWFRPYRSSGGGGGFGRLAVCHAKIDTSSRLGKRTIIRTRGKVLIGYCSSG